MFLRHLRVLGALCLFFTPAVFAQATPAELALAGKKDEQVEVWGKAQESRSASYTNPTSVLTQEDIAAINVATTEDVVKFEPGIVIRRRYIGDSNGTLGLRGSNMFATSRSMVFADGVPLHYFLQSRWNGAPRWTLVSASEIAQVEVLYGPFSAEYSGNAMGGVVLIETAIPQQREIHIDLDAFSQTVQAYAFNETLPGYNSFIAYGDKFADSSVYVSYNRLRNQSQAQSFYFDGRTPDSNSLPVDGALPGKDIYGDAKLYIGDSGIEDASTDNFKFKIGHDFGAWSSLLNIAYEDRTTLRDSPNSYLRNTRGETLWSGNFIQDGQGLGVNPSLFGVSELNRKSLSTGLRIKGDVNSTLKVEAYVSDFRILEDINRAAAANPEDPNYNGSGQTTEYDDTGWQTADIKARLSDFGFSNMEWVAGARYESYRLHLDVYNSNDWQAGKNNGFTARSGGTSCLAALFLQNNWDINAFWKLSLGLRFENWQSSEGYFSRNDPQTHEFDLVEVPGTSREQTSPKFSLAYSPDDNWQVRYSLARAYRFPIVEELFSQYEAYNAINEANPELKPENGVHQNLMLEKRLVDGYWRINIFTETIEDSIESQASLLPGGGSVRTFAAIDEVKTDGVEYIVNQEGFLLEALDLRFNIAYTDARIIDNSGAEGESISPSASIEGNDMPRMPKWRGNVLSTYRFSDKFKASANLQYASKSFGRLDNLDTEENVMGAQDGYTRLGIKGSYSVTEQLELGLGVDNLSNEIAYVAHPWPGRTFYLNISYSQR